MFLKSVTFWESFFHKHISLSIAQLVTGENSTTAHRRLEMETSNLETGSQTHRNVSLVFVLLGNVSRNVGNGPAVAENEKDQNPSKC